MNKIDNIITEHLGKDWHTRAKDWHTRANVDIPELQVLFDRLQEENLSLRRSVWEILYIAALKDKYGSIWSSQPSQAREYAVSLVGLWGDLKGAVDYYTEYCVANGPIPSLCWFGLFKNILKAVEAIGMNSSRLPD